MTTSRPIVFVDTETTSLGHLAHPWEIAVIIREGGVTQEWVGQVEYAISDLPDGTQPSALHVGGWLVRGAPHSGYAKEIATEAMVMVADEASIAHAAHELLQTAVMVGVGVHFDAAVLSSMFRRHGLPDEPWHYGLVDLKAATWGNIAAHVAAGQHDLKHLLDLPPSSEQLALAAGVEPPTGYERHTALGDARWAARWFDALTAGTQ